MASNSAAPSITNEPDHTGSPGPAHGGLGLAGQVGLIQREPIRRGDGPVGDHLVAGRQAQEIPHHHLVDRHPVVDPVSYDNRLRSDQRGEPVESPLGADLLEGPGGSSVSAAQSAS